MASSRLAITSRTGLRLCSRSTVSNSSASKGQSSRSGGTLQSVDHPASGRPWRVGTPVNGEHRQAEPARWGVFDRELDQAPLGDVLSYGLKRHPAPSEAADEECVLGEQVREAPGRGRHHTELA